MGIHNWPNTNDDYTAFKTKFMPLGVTLVEFFWSPEQLGSYEGRNCCVRGDFEGYCLWMIRTQQATITVSLNLFGKPVLIIYKPQTYAKYALSSLIIGQLQFFS